MPIDDPAKRLAALNMRARRGNLIPDGNIAPIERAYMAGGFYYFLGLPPDDGLPFRVGGVTGLGLVIEIAPGNTPFDDLPTWVNISGSVQSWSTTRGRQNELSDFAMGQVNIRLVNTDRAFDPLYASSPYAPYIRPMTPVRIRASYDVAYPIFTGYASEWQPGYEIDRADGTGWAYCDLSAGDGQKVFAAHKLDSVWAETVKADGALRAWWRFNETAGDVMIDSSGNRFHGRYARGTTGRSTSGLLRYSNDKAIEYDTLGEAIVTGQVLRFSGWSIEGWFSAVPQVDGAVLFRSTVHPPSVNTTTIELLPASGGESMIRYSVYKDLNNYKHITTVASYADDVAHHLVAWRGQSVLTLHVDGMEVEVTEASAGSITLHADFGTTVQLGYGSFSESLDGIMDEWVVSESDLSVEAANRYQAGNAPWDGDMPGGRIERVANLVGWPFGGLDLSPGVSTLGAASLAGDALSAIQEVATADRGLVFFDRYGRVCYRGRVDVRAAPEYTDPQVVFGDQAGQIGYSDVTFDTPETWIYNRCVVTSRTGCEFFAVDVDSRNLYGERTITLETPDLSDAQAQALAESTVARYKDPQTRVASLTIPTSRSAEHLVAVLGLELGHRVTVVRNPPGGGAAITQECYVEQISHQCNPSRWDTTLSLSPADLNTYAIVDVSLVGDGAVLG